MKMKTKKENIISKKLIFVLSTICLILSLVTGCNFDHDCDHHNGSGNLTEETRTLGTFTSIRILGAAWVYIRNESADTIQVQTDDNLMKYVITKISGDTLVIDTRDNISSRHGVKIYLSMTNINALRIDGAATVLVEEYFSVNDIKLDIDGAGKIEAAVNAGNVTSSIDGAGKIVISGTATSHTVRIKGAGAVKASHLEPQSSNIEINGAGVSNVYVTQQLDAYIAGAGIIYYKGDPATVNSEIHGVGKVIKD